MNHDNLFEQMTAISKAHAYDILVEQVKELKAVINELIIEGELDDLTFTDQEETNKFKELVKKAKKLSYEYK